MWDEDAHMGGSGSIPQWSSQLGRTEVPQVPGLQCHS